MSLSLPASAETYAKAAQLHQAILEETQQDAQLAEQEWKRVPRHSGLSHASASSSVNLRPSGAGVDILIRYVTRASDRLKVRNRLNERVHRCASQASRGDHYLSALKADGGGVGGRRSL